MIINYDLLYENGMLMGKQSDVLKSVFEEFVKFKEMLLQYNDFQLLSADLDRASMELSECVELLYKIKMVLCDIAETYRSTEEELSNSLYMSERFEKTDFPIVNELGDLPEIPFG